MEILVTWQKYNHILCLDFFMVMAGLGWYVLLFSFYCEIDIKKRQQPVVFLPIPLHYKNAEMIPMIPEELRGADFCKHQLERRVGTLNGPISTFGLYVFILCLKKVPIMKCKKNPNYNDVQKSELINSVWMWVPLFKAVSSSSRKSNCYCLKERGRMRRK